MKTKADTDHFERRSRSADDRGYVSRRYEGTSTKGTNDMKQTILLTALVLSLAGGSLSIVRLCDVGGFGSGPRGRRSETHLEPEADREPDAVGELSETRARQVGLNVARVEVVGQIESL